MQIDWFTTAAQFINFFVLVWLLRRFLFRPVTDAIEARRIEVEDAYAAAASRERVADSEREALAAERKELADAIERRMNAAEAEADAHKVHLRNEAEAEEARLRVEFLDMVASERQIAWATLQAEAGRAAIDIARQVLRDLADEELEVLLLRRLGDQLAALDRDATPASDAPLAVTLTCRWPKPPADPALSDRLSRELGRVTGRPVTLSIAHDVAAPVGAVLEAPGFHAAWSLEGHIDRVMEGFEKTTALRGAAASQA